MNDCWIMIVARPPEIKEKAPKNRLCLVGTIFNQCGKRSHPPTTGGNIWRHAIFSAEPIVLTHFGQTPRVLSRSYLVNTPPGFTEVAHFPEFWTYLAKKSVKYGVRSPKFNWASFAQLYSLAKAPQPPPRIWAHIRWRYWSVKNQDRRHLDLKINDKTLCDSAQNYVHEVSR